MTSDNLTKRDVAFAFQNALQRGKIRREDTAVIFFDLDYLSSRLQRLCSSFPEGTLHAIAIKANPLLKILAIARQVSPSIGVEAASVGEVHQALKAGFNPGQIVFDSPVKTISDLEFALQTGVHLNIDNFDELERVATLTGSPHPVRVPAPRQGVGLRINPQVGVGKIVGSSVAGLYSKFGIPIQSKRQELKNAFLAYPWLTGVHLHVGSQGCPLELLADGVGILYDFVAEINPERLAAGFPPISVFDIGGGLPISYDSSVAPPSMENYIDLIRKRAPGLFSLNLITEFGRWIFTNPGWTVSRVEYVKHDEYANTAMLHVGADLFLRECLNPIDWQHEYSVLDSQGNLREGIDLQPWTLAGPLCFSGDIIAKGVMLPAIEEGDYLVIHDTGGYTFSMWSRYNSRQTPRILGYRGQEFEILKERESISDMLKFWE